MLPKSRLPGPFPQRPRPQRQARASRAGRGRGGSGRREVRFRHAPHSLREREQRAPVVRVAIFFFPPSVRLSAVGFVCPPRRPSPPRRQLGPQSSSAHRGRVPGRPGPASPSCGRGPLSRGLSVRRRSPGTRSAEAAGKVPPRREPAARVAPVGPRRRPPFVCSLLGRGGLGAAAAGCGPRGPASDRLGWSWGRGGWAWESGRGGGPRPSWPGQAGGRAEELLNLDFGEG